MYIFELSFVLFIQKLSSGEEFQWARHGLGQQK